MEDVIGGRISFRRRVDRLELHISSKKDTFELLFLPVWLVGWSFGGAVAISAITGGKVPNDDLPFIVAWIAFWFTTELLKIFTILWGMFGREIVVLDSEELKVGRKIFGRGLTGYFPTEEITSLRAFGAFGGSRLSFRDSLPLWGLWGLSGGVLAFDHRNKTHRFGIKLDEDDATRLASVLNEFLNSQPRRLSYEKR